MHRWWLGFNGQTETQNPNAFQKWLITGVAVDELLQQPGSILYYKITTKYSRSHQPSLTLLGLTDARNNIKGLKIRYNRKMIHSSRTV